MDDDLQPHPRACCLGRDTRRLIVTNPILTPFDETVPLALCLSIVPDATPRREVVYFGSHGLQGRRPTT